MQDYRIAQLLERKLINVGMPINGCTIDVDYNNSFSFDTSYDIKIRYFIELSTLKHDIKEQIFVHTIKISHEELDDKQASGKNSFEQFLVWEGFNYFAKKYHEFKKLKDNGLCLLHIKSDDHLIRKLCKGVVHGA